MKLTRLVPLAAAAAMLAACSPAGNTAFVVDGEATPSSLIDRYAADCRHLMSEDLTVAPRDVVLEQLILSKLAQQHAEGLDLSREAGRAAGARVDDEACGDLLYANYQAITWLQSSPDAQQQLLESDVQLNPRYGQWQPDLTAGRLRNPSGSLSVAAGQAEQ